VSDVARQGIPGWDVLRDHTHLKPHVVGAEAREILLLARRAVGPDKPFELAASGEPSPNRVDIARALGQVTSAQAESSEAFAQRWAHAAAYAVEQWLALGYSNVDLAVDEYLGGPVFARVTDERRRACLLTALAEGYWNGGRKERALELSDRALRSASAEARTERALIEVARNRPQAARDLLNAALELERNRADARFYLDHIEQQQAAAR
jgi:hypothetical protein